jgi:hypothetical protein
MFEKDMALALNEDEPLILSPVPSSFLAAESRL